MEGRFETVERRDRVAVIIPLWNGETGSLLSFRSVETLIGLDPIDRTEPEIITTGEACVSPAAGICIAFNYP